ncbi:aromatic amino acid ammonia-lyase [Paracoccus aminophilus]|uniref:Phenylalanine/histidine ammonia-lyase n=1 Tax=Paracoccus aminophilus JCM 7686 TaxID=1367847 RepID=S5Y5I4_PARAH|nr:aromatic amino acid ammonia-lyase [Paracoccus aminophilus]AGT10975.1 phenylalanine/histidine ammonia-lyase [Paracoccus aminophilus JCM 7686]
MSFHDRTKTIRFSLGVVVFHFGLATSAPYAAADFNPEPRYQPITAKAAEKTVTLTGRDLTVEQVIEIARDGAKVEQSPEALQRAADAYGLLLQGAAEGMPIYWFNRGSGSNRETVIFDGDPTSPENDAMLKKQQLARFQNGAKGGYPPEIFEEELVRAIMAIRANTITYEAASPDLVRMLPLMLNHHVTPIVMSRGTLGEGDLPTMGNIAAAMVGAGEAYFEGKRMPAAEALEKAGLKPLVPTAADEAALISTNAYAYAQLVMVVSDGREVLDWADLSYAIALNGMNSSLTPISAPVQAMRPYDWLNWDAARVLDMVKGSYLFEADPARIIQDPISMRASTQRQGSAWMAWANLRDSLQIAINSSDHNPAVVPGIGPDSSWELSSSQFMKYHVKGGPLSGGKSGYIFSNANWDPYPIANETEAFTIALTNAGAAVAQRLERFNNPFFTVITPSDVIEKGTASENPPSRGGYLPTDLWQELAELGNPVTPNGQAIVATVEDLEAQTRMKGQRARQAVSLMSHLLAQDLLTATYWLDIRKLQDPSREFGAAPTAAHAALRKEIPWRMPADQRPARAPGMIAYEFMWAHPAASFYSGGPTPPAARPIPRAGMMPD